MGTSGNGAANPVNNLHKRKEQLTAWETSEANRAPSSVKNPVKVKFKPEVAFLAACTASDFDEIARFLNDKVDINTSNIDGLTALHQACIDSKLDLIKFLIDHGADIHARDSEGWTPLHATALGGHVEVAKYLLKEGAMVGIANNDGDLPIDVAESWDMKQLLKESMARIDENRARNAEALAMQKDARAWLKEGRYRCLRDPRSHATPLHVAAAKGYSIVLSTLLQCPGVDINDRDCDGWTPLHAAAHWGQEGACRVLVANGADMAAVTHANQTVLDIAEEALVQLLKELQVKQKELMQQESAKRPIITSIKEDDGTKSYTSRRSSVTRVTQSERHDLTCKSAEIEKHPESLPTPPTPPLPPPISIEAAAAAADGGSGGDPAALKPPLAPPRSPVVSSPGKQLTPPLEEPPPTEPKLTESENSQHATAEANNDSSEDTSNALAFTRAAERRRQRAEAAAAAAAASAAAAAAAAATAAATIDPSTPETETQNEVVKPTNNSNVVKPDQDEKAPTEDASRSDNHIQEPPPPSVEEKQRQTPPPRPLDFSPGKEPSASVKTLLKRMESLQEGSGSNGFVVQTRRRFAVNGSAPSTPSSPRHAARLGRTTSLLVSASSGSNNSSLRLGAKPEPSSLSTAPASQGVDVGNSTRTTTATTTTANVTGNAIATPEKGYEASSKSSPTPSGDQQQQQQQHPRVSAIMEKEKVEESETERRRISRRNRATKRATQGVSQEVVEQARKLVEDRRASGSGGSGAQEVGDAAPAASASPAAADVAATAATPPKTDRRSRLSRRQPTGAVLHAGSRIDEESDSGCGSTQGLATATAGTPEPSTAASGQSQQQQPPHHSAGLTRSRPGSYHGSLYSGTPSSSAADSGSGAIDYKRLYEKEKAVNERLTAENARLREDNEQLKRQSSEQRQIDKRLSEYEAQNRTLEQVTRENEKLKAENRALARVVARLSRQ